MRPSQTLRALALAGLASWMVTARAPMAQAQINLPALGDSVSDDFDILVERKLGDRYMRDIRRDPSVMDDPLLLEHVQSVWQPLLSAARERGDITPDLDRAFAWEPFLVREKEVNAFALPGGYVGVVMGLIAMTSSRDEMASVLAHELTHINQRHIARSMVSNSKNGAATLAAILLGLAVASRSGNPDALAAVIVGGQATMIQQQLNFSREMEREADRIGVDLLTRAQFAPGGMAAMFEKLDNNSRLNDSNQYPYLRSHPLTVERIAEARLRTQDASAPPAPAAAVLRHTLMQARAKVLMDKAEPAMRRVQSQADSAPTGASPEQRLAALYAGALASLELRDHARAERLVNAALEHAQANATRLGTAVPVLTQLKVQTLIERARAGGPLSADVATLMASLSDDFSRPVMLLRVDVAQARLRAHETQAPAALREAMEGLQTWVLDHRRDASAWKALAQCAEPLGLRQRALRADAEFAYSLGDLLGAYDRLKVAQAMGRGSPGQDDVEASIVSTRIREIEPERRRWLAELRGERVD